MDLFDLPDGVIEEICTAGVLKPGEVLLLGSTCRKLNEITQRNCIWKYHCASKIPQLFKDDKFSQAVSTSDTSVGLVRSDLKENNVVCWKSVYKYFCAVEKNLLKLVRLHVAFGSLDKDAVESVFEGELIKSKNILFCVFFAFSDPCSPSMTVRYYAKHCLRALRRPVIAQQIKNVFENSVATNINYKGKEISASPEFFVSLLFSEYFNSDDPSQSNDEVLGLVADAVEEVKSNLSKCGDVVKAINYVFFECLQFKGNAEDYYDVKNSFLHFVCRRRCGIPMTLSILYQQIAHALGIDMEIINYPGHIILRRQMSEIDSRLPNVDYDNVYSFIDVFNGGNLHSFTDLGKRHILLQPSNFQNVVLRMCQNVITHSDHQSNSTNVLPAINLYLTLQPEDVYMRMRRMLVFFDRQCNLHTVLEDFDFLTSNAPDTLLAHIPKGLKKVCESAIEKRQQEPPEVRPKSRSQQMHKPLEYSVGLVMKHRRYNYTCVIRGWDHFCDMSEEWIRQMGVNRLEYGKKQPFYNVLVHGDGTERYAAQENLSLLENSSEEIEHDEIGRYFCEVTKINSSLYYFPNSQVKLEYPEDAQVTKDILAKIVQK